MAATVVPPAHEPAIHQSEAKNSTVMVSSGTVTATPANAHSATLAPSDSTNPGPDAGPALAISAATALPAGNGTQAGQPHDTRSDPVAPPVFGPNTGTPAAPPDVANVPPFASAALPTGTAGEQIAMHVAQSLNAGGKTITIELHPAELGRVEIHFSFHSDGTNVRMTVDRPETFDALSHDRNGLQQQLSQAGVDLGGGGLDLRLGQQQSDDSGSYSGARTPRVTTPAPQPQGTAATLWVSNSLLDILA
jgi:flagellar hook-length control protein FliK